MTTRKPNEAEQFDSATRGAEAVGRSADAAVAIRTGRWVAEWKDGWRVVKVAAVGLSKEEAEELAALANAIERMPMR